MTKKLTLESLVFKDEIDKSVFLEILYSLNYIKPKFISRKDFNDKAGIFLEQWSKSKTNSKENEYILYLPVDLTIWELPAIIKSVNEKSFWKKCLNMLQLKN